MRINLSGVDDSDVGSGGGIPAGTYLCVISDPQIQNEHGEEGRNPCLNFGLRVIEGEYEGSMAGFDRLYFHNDPCRKRAKFVLKRLGLVVPEEEFEIEPEALNNRQVRVTTQPDPKCPECKWSIEITDKDADGNAIAKCKSTKGCTWAGLAKDALQYTSPKWGGYELVEADEMSDEATAKQADIEKLPF